MNINLTIQSINFGAVEVGDILITSTGHTFLIVTDSDGDYTATDLTDSTAHSCCCDTVFALCEDIEEMKDCQIIKRVPHREINLSIMEAI